MELLTVYKVLSNLEKQRIYDQHGVLGIQEGGGGGPGFFSPIDMFDMFLRED